VTEHGNGVPAGSRTVLTRDNLRRAYHTAVTRVGDPAARLAYTPRRVLRALRAAGPGQTPQALRDRLRGRLPTTPHRARGALRAGGGRAGGPSHCRRRRATTLVGRGAASRRPLADLKLRGPHDLRHTFSTWLEDAGIPARVIDELMGHAGGPGGRDSSPIGVRYRHTTPEMEARAVAAIEERLAIALTGSGVRATSSEVAAAERC
jgi:integrase